MPRSNQPRQGTDVSFFGAPTRRAFLARSAAVLGVGGLGRAARAGQAYPHLADKTVTMLVGAEVGGGFDLCGRTLATHMERLVPGLRIEIKNVTQASGMLAAKMLQEGPQDGSMLFTSSPSLLSAQILGEDGVAFDLRQWGWLGKLTAETYMLIKGPGADFTNLDELRAKQAPSSMSCRSTSAIIYHQALWLNAMLGTRIKPVPGYKSVEREAALIQGEVMLTIDTYPSGGPLLESPDVDVILRLAGGEVPERFRSKPILADLAADHPIYAPMVALNEAIGQLSRWFAASPGTDPAVLADWRALFDATVSHPPFVSDLGRLNFKVDAMTGPQVAETVQSVLADQERTRELLQSSLECGKALADGLTGSCTAS
jgi:tripartite-type tricarboxylate transporter receptor subunit TctC